MRKVIEINELRNVALKLRPDTSVQTIVSESEKMYEAIKLYGVKSISMQYLENDFLRVRTNGENSPAEVRSLAAYIMMNLLQMSDSATSVGRLQRHYGNILIESTVGYKLGLNSEVTEKSILEIVEQYCNKKDSLEQINEVFTQELYELIVKHNPDISLMYLWAECENFYKSIVTVGFQNTVCCVNNGSSKIIMRGSEIPERMRAFVVIVIAYMYQLRDKVYLDGLRKRFMLASNENVILGDTGIFENENYNSLGNIVGRYLGKDFAGRVTEKTILMQIPYDVVEKKIFNPEDFESTELLWVALESFYKISKINGVNNVRVRYVDASGKDISQRGNEVPLRIRAICEESVIYMYRIDDSDESRTRLDKYLGLDYPSKLILSNTKAVVARGSSMPCISFTTLIKRYLEDA